MRHLDIGILGSYLISLYHAIEISNTNPKYRFKVDEELQKVNNKLKELNLGQICLEKD